MMHVHNYKQSITMAILSFSIANLLR